MSRDWTAEQVVAHLGLRRLPHEGGFFRETYHGPIRLPAESLPEHGGDRYCSTAIYYLVTPEEFSAFHRLPQDEMFHFYLGDPVEMVQIAAGGQLTRILLGSDLSTGHRPQVLAPGQTWQGCRLVAGGRWALLGATVSPGFDYADYEHGHRERLLAAFPQHADWVRALTRA